MTRGMGEAHKVVYRGNVEVFIVILESVEEYEKFKKSDNQDTYSLTGVVDSFQIFTTLTQGSQGIMDAASNRALENEFGTHELDKCIRQILQKGALQTRTSDERGATTNMSQGSRGGH